MPMTTPDYIARLDNACLALARWCRENEGELQAALRGQDLDLQEGVEIAEELKERLAEWAAATDAALVAVSSGPVPQ